MTWGVGSYVVEKQLKASSEVLSVLAALLPVQFYAIDVGIGVEDAQGI